MSGFSIDLAADRIVDHRTRSYFQEVARSFSNECYRGSLVMLWTVVVCDLVYKLQTLRDLYSDAAAGRLLSEVEAKQASSPNSPDWEIFLLEEVAKRTKMLETTDYVQLQQLQKLRHLSAHPILTAADLLFRPTKEMARAQIRMALEAVLLKPALFSKRIIDALVEDVATNKALLISGDKLKLYLEARYLQNMPRAIELELFRALWKFCFKLKNAETDVNRQINTETLTIVFNRNAVAIRDMMDGDRAFFSNVGPETDLLDALIDFLSDHRELYGSLDVSGQILIAARADANIDNRVKASFLAASTAAHLLALHDQSAKELAKMEEGVWTDLVDHAEADGQLESALILAIKIYGESGGYDAADIRFARFVRPILSRFTVSTMHKLLTAIEGNAQTYDRIRAKLDHPLVKIAADALKIDLSGYPMFNGSL
jgi:hypothetical protein